MVCLLFFGIVVGAHWGVERCFGVFLWFREGFGTLRATLGGSPTGYPSPPPTGYPAVTSFATDDPTSTMAHTPDIITPNRINASKNKVKPAKVLPITASMYTSYKKEIVRGLT